MRYRRRVLALLFFLSIITYIDRVCIGVASPRMQEELGIPPSQWGLVLGAFALSYAAFELPSGAMGDRIGPRKVLTRIVLWWSVFTSLTGTATSYLQLLTCRFLFGAGEAGAYPNTSGAIARWFPAAERGRAQGAIWMASRLGGALSPLIVVPIQARYGWRTSFWVFGCVGLVWAAVWYWWFRDNPAEKSGVTPAEMEEIRSGGAVDHVHHKLPLGTLLSSGNMWLIMAMYFTYCYASFFYLSWMPTYLIKGRGFSERDMAWFATMPFILGCFSTMLGGWASDAAVARFGLKWGRRVCAVGGLTASAIFTIAAAVTEHKVLAVILLALGYAGSDFMLPTAWALCLDIGKKYAGAVTGAMNTAGQAGSFTTAALFGFLVERFHSYNLPLVPMSLLTLVSAILWLKIDPTKQLVPEPIEPR
jgi:MFS transporter, ACS family, glucarate transporter